MEEPGEKQDDRSDALITFAGRKSDSPFVERVWASRSDRAGVFRSIASCHSGIVISRLRGKTTLTVRGPETFATLAECPPDGEWHGVLFKLGVFLPGVSGFDLRDRKDHTLPGDSGRSFWLDGSAWEFPTYENIESFVDRLARRGLIRIDAVADAAIRGESRGVTSRTEQRRVLSATGLTQGAIFQIERARRATLRLKQGAPILDVVHETGYYDQAHLTRSVQRFIGQSPSRVANGCEQLSLLYNQ